MVLRMQIMLRKYCHRTLINSKITAGGPCIPHPLGWGGRPQFDFTKEDLIDIHVSYFKVGLENNEFCLWVLSYPLKVEDAIRVLSRVVPDFNVYQETGQIEIISYKDWFFTEGILDFKRVLNSWIEKLNYASLNGYEGFRFCDNTSWLRKEDWNSFIKYMEL